MRVYIYKITKRELEHKPDLYNFTQTITPAWHWPTKEAAERACRLFSAFGIRIELPTGEHALCREYRVDQRPEGGFAVSCEYPFADDPLKSVSESEAPTISL